MFFSKHCKDSKEVQYAPPHPPSLPPSFGMHYEAQLGLGEEIVVGIGGSFVLGGSLFFNVWGQSS